MNGEKHAPSARAHTLQPGTQALESRTLKSGCGRRGVHRSIMEGQPGPQHVNPDRAETLSARMLDEFVALHGPALRSSGVPERLWGRLLHKLEHEVRSGSGCGQRAGCANKWGAQRSDSEGEPLTGSGAGCTWNSEGDPPKVAPLRPSCRVWARRGCAGTCKLTWAWLAASQHLGCRVRSRTRDST